MKLLLVEDHLYVSESLQLLLERTVELSTATSCMEALELIKNESHYDLILLDMGLPDSDGQSLLQFFQHHDYFPPVLIITGKDNVSDTIRMAKSMGAKGFYHKSKSPALLLEAIDKLLLGEESWPVGSVIETLAIDEKIANLAKHLGITSRQLDVLKLLDEGLQNKQIAEKLSISESTVKTHIKALYNVLGAKTRSGCVKTARQLGLFLIQ
ncbi:MAG: response regulator [Gammaproteobacteria bacterium]